MHIEDVFDAHKTTFSFEFFPPKSDAAAASLYQSIAELKTLKPSFVSVTYGAGGSTRQRTHDLVIRVRNELGVTSVPHLTCVCHSEQDIADTRNTAPARHARWLRPFVRGGICLNFPASRAAPAGYGEMDGPDRRPPLILVPSPLSMIQPPAELGCLNTTLRKRA